VARRGADVADGRDAWRELPVMEWARLAGGIGMRPSVVALFESVVAKEGRVRFYKASRQCGDTCYLCG
jgi:hypothetical protein